MQATSRNTTRRRGVRLALIALLVVFCLDVLLSNLADRHLRTADYHFHDAQTAAQLDFTGPRQQGCDARSVFTFYIYKTCFVLNNSFEDQQRWLFEFVYARPRPILLGGRNTNSYRFQMIAAAPVKKRIFFGGAIETIAP